MSRERKQQHPEGLRSRILEAAQTIILEEGVEALSVRRVAKEIDYTAPIIYEYFRNKNQLLSCAIKEGYWKILKSVEPVPPGFPPDRELRQSFKNFVENAVRVPIAYKAFILQTSSDLLAETSILGKDGCKNSPTLASIVSTLKAGIEMGLFMPCDVQQTAKVCWSSMFGLFFRLVVETDVSAAEREELIELHLDVLMRGLSVR
jgi:AcrR family transcriptional regulator